MFSCTTPYKTTKQQRFLSFWRQRECKKDADPGPKTAAIRRDNTYAVISSHQANTSHELLKALAQYSQHHLAAGKKTHVDSGLQGNELMKQGTPEDWEERRGASGGSRLCWRRQEATNPPRLLPCLLVGGSGGGCVPGTEVVGLRGVA